MLLFNPAFASVDFTEFLLCTKYFDASITVL